MAKRRGRPYSTNEQVIRIICDVPGCDRVASSRNSHVCRVHAHDPDHCKCRKCLGTYKPAEPRRQEQVTITLPDGFGGQLP